VLVRETGLTPEQLDELPAPVIERWLLYLELEAEAREAATRRTR